MAAFQSPASANQRHQADTEAAAAAAAALFLSYSRRAASGWPTASADSSEQPQVSTCGNKQLASSSVADDIVTQDDDDEDNGDFDINDVDEQEGPTAPPAPPAPPPDASNKQRQAAAEQVTALNLSMHDNGAAGADGSAAAKGALSDGDGASATDTDEDSEHYGQVDDELVDVNDDNDDNEHVMNAINGFSNLNKHTTTDSNATAANRQSLAAAAAVASIAAAAANSGNLSADNSSRLQATAAYAAHIRGLIDSLQLQTGNSINSNANTNSPVDPNHRLSGSKSSKLLQPHTTNNNNNNNNNNNAIAANSNINHHQHHAPTHLHMQSSSTASSYLSSSASSSSSSSCSSSSSSSGWSSTGESLVSSCSPEQRAFAGNGDAAKANQQINAPATSTGLAMAQANSLIGAATRLQSLQSQLQQQQQKHYQANKSNSKQITDSHNPFSMHLKNFTSNGCNQPEQQQQQPAVSAAAAAAAVSQLLQQQQQLQSEPQQQQQQQQQQQHHHQPQQQHQQQHQRPLFFHHHNHPHHHAHLHSAHHHHELGPAYKADSDDLDRIRSFIEQFKSRRGALGLTQKQAAQCFRAYTDDRYAFSDNFVGHFEGFQFRPQTAMTIADSLAEWLEFAENETRQGRQLSFMPGKVKETRKRKYEVIRIRDSAKRVLVEAFEKNRSPSTSELEMLSKRTSIPSRNIEIFFKNRRTSRQYHQ